jgi:hypothetical protein
MDLAGNVARMGERRSAYKGLVGRPEGKRQLGRPRHKKVDNIKWMFKNWDWEVWTWLVWLRVGTGGWLLCIR